MISVSAADSPIGVLHARAGAARPVAAGARRRDAAERRRRPAGSGLGVRAAEDDAALADVRDQLDRYFAGELQEFDVELDWTLVHGFRRACCEAHAAHPLRHDRDVRRAGRGRGQPTRGASGWSGLRDQPDRDHRLMSSRARGRTGWAATAAASTRSARCWRSKAPCCSPRGSSRAGTVRPPRSRSAGRAGAQRWPAPAARRRAESGTRRA